ncbi:Na(+)-translocating NADH-quinone reductase subunit C [hydrothermal vent metagenome]|uniref:Na(+)-translocating NADH-quinone reductase subunit C n=1 Tax=hydrothermal vent metagenome TaxID=652676 RepID=A0A3B0UM20_9ZZZZ
MNRNGNTYTFIYAAIMVIIVAAVLSAVAMSLKPLQTRNFEIEKKKSILASVNIASTSENAEEIYAQKIVKSYVVDVHGNQIDGDAFNIDLKKEHAKKPENRSLPVFECKTSEGTKYILPLRGTGLWGPIWGYLSLDKDMNTIYGVNFDHQGETPGLGAEITTKMFEDPFKGKKIFDESGKLVSITVAKVNETAPAEHRVDAISGGTITSKGLQKMLFDDLTNYKEFLIKKKS